VSKNQYPLKQIIEVKQKRVDDAEKIVKERLEALKKEQEKLAQREAERDKVKSHQQDKLRQLRETLDKDTTSPKVQQMKVYLKVVDEKLKVEEKKVAEQKKEVENAEKKLEEARKELRLRQQELDKILQHKKEWERSEKIEVDRKEEREQDEMGNLIHSHKYKES
jgi:flagellar biosynthesis chaperone FliJ